MKKYFILLAFILIFTSCSGGSDIDVSVDNNSSGLVLMYHFLTEDSSKWSDFCVSPQQLEDDIQFFISRGYTFATPSMLDNMNQKLEETLKSPGKFVLLTFDDGYESDYKYVFPLLKKYNVPATFFVPGSTIGTNEYVSVPEINEMSKSDLVEYGNHGNKIHRYSKDNLKALYRSKNEIKFILSDYEENDRLITNITGKKPASISYPYGFYTDYVDEAIKEKFKCLTFSTKYGITSLPLGNRPIKRMNRAFSLNLNNIAK